MLNRKLLEVLKLLNASERARLRLFLLSPYFNGRSNAQDLLRLHDYIISFEADEQHPSLSKEQVAKEFFPDKIYVEGKKGPVDGLASDLFGLVRRFMAQVAFDVKDIEFEENLALAKFYRRYGMEERFWQVIRITRDSQNSSEIKNAGYFHKRYLIEEEAASFESLNNSFEDDANLSIASENLDISYEINKLELLCALSYQQKLSQQVTFDQNLPLTQAVLKTTKDIPLLKLYTLVFKLIQTPEDDDLFKIFVDSIKEFNDQVPFLEIRNFKAFYRFFWNQRYVKSGGKFVRSQMFQVYKEHFEQGYFYEDGLILINSLKVLVLFGLKEKQFDWVKKVLDDHPSSRICGTRHPVEAHNLCLAEYYFYIKEYDRALETLVYKHFENPNFSLWAEMLLIKIYYETSDDLLEYRMKALDQKVRRSKISTELKSQYYRFLQKLDKIVKYGPGRKNAKQERLLEEIKTTPGIIEREWLLEKLGAGG